MMEAVADAPGVEVRSLYAMYPDFGIDVEAEQDALVRAKLIVLQHPLYWYTVPGLMKHWFDKVLARGFAYGDGGRALHGKRCLWVVTTGGDEHAFSDEGMHRRSFESYLTPIRQVAEFCGIEAGTDQKVSRLFVAKGKSRAGKADRCDDVES